MDTDAAIRLAEELAQDRRVLRRDAILTAATFVGLAFGLAAPALGLPEARGWSFALAYLSGGVPAAVRAVRSLSRRHLHIDLLMVVAALAAAAVGEARDGAILLLLFQLAETLEAYAMGTTKRAVAGLMELRPDTARRVDPGGNTEVVPVADARVGDTVRVLPGERLPVDGEVLRGRSSIDQSNLTGESVPVDKGPGDQVFAGTVNGHGAIDLRVTSEASASTLARMIDLVTEAQAARAPSQRVSDWFGTRYTFGVLGGATLTLLGFGLLGPSWSDAAYTAATLLVVASPCAVVISVPAAVLAALAAAARRGVLFKGGGALETFGRADAFVFDKTGTLSEGRMRVLSIRPLSDVDEAGILRLTAGLERHSEHPVAKAVVDAALARDLDLPDATDPLARPGQGIEGRLEGRSYWVGNRRLAALHGADPAEGDAPAAQAALEALEDRGATVVLLGEGERILAAIGVADAVRPEAAEALARLREAGVRTIAMLTGDHPAVAYALAANVGIAAEDVHAELLPEDKVRAVAALAESRTVAYVGDGVNDAAALATAQVGVAMGASGSDVALETADIALLANDLRRLPVALRLARRANRVIAQNLTFALGVMVIMVAWTLLGNLPLPLGVIAHEGGTLVVVANGLRLLLPDRRDSGAGPGGGRLNREAHIAAPSLAGGP